MSSSYFNVMHAIISLQICMLATHAKSKKDDDMEHKRK